MLAIDTAPSAGDQGQLPYTLGFAAPEVLVQQQSHMGPCEKADVYAVGIMGLLWMGPDRELPFGPSKKVAQEVHAAQGTSKLQGLFEAARESVVQMQRDWVS